MAAAPNRRAKEQRVALHSLQNAEQCLLMQNYGRAFAHYLLVLKLMPEKKAEIKSNFTLALREWAETLERSGRLEDLFMCYQQACELFPECETMLNNMGAQLFRLGYVDEAACCFRRALKLAPDLLGARENLDNVCGHLVERWHFRMLNDTTRNQHYRQAIHNAIQAGHTTMLDIGTGTALLSLFGVEGGAQHVWGCETSKTMFEVSCDVVSANHMEDRISLIHKISTDMNVPQDLPQKVSLIVTETFDAGLLGESILDTLDHAWKKLLSQNVQSGLKPQVIPSGATVYVCAIESHAIRQNSRCLYPGLRDLDLSNVDMTCPTSSYWLPGGGTSEDWEPYSAERLTTLKGGYRILTEVTETFKFNFNDPKLVEKYRRGMSEFMTLPIINVGRVDALAVWFDLHLDPQVSLSTCPEAQSCWEQAIFPVLPSHLKHRDQHESFIMKPGDSLEIASGCHDNSLHFQCTAVNRKPKPVSPQWQSNAIAAPKPNNNKNDDISYANGLPNSSISPKKKKVPTATLR